MDEFRIPRRNHVDLVFDGEVLADVTADDGVRDRWQRLRLYRTSQENYVLEIMGESRLEGEFVIRQVSVCDSAEAVRDRLVQRDDRPEHNGRTFLTHLAIELLEDAADVDPAFENALEERV